MTCVLFVKWIKFSVKKTKHQKKKKYWKNGGKKYCQGILLVQKSGNHVMEQSPGRKLSQTKLEVQGLGDNQN